MKVLLMLTKFVDVSQATFGKSWATTVLFGKRVKCAQYDIGRNLAFSNSHNNFSLNCLNALQTVMSGTIFGYEIYTT